MWKILKNIWIFTKNFIFEENKNSKSIKWLKLLKVLINEYEKKYEIESSEKIIRKKENLRVENNELRRKFSKMKIKFLPLANMMKGVYFIINSL